MPVLKFKGREITEEEYDEIIENNEHITVDYWEVNYDNGVNHLVYEPILPLDTEDYQYEEMNKYISDAVDELEIA